jgi:hypothetical protein
MWEGGRQGERAALRLFFGFLDYLIRPLGSAEGWQTSWCSERNAWVSSRDEEAALHLLI